MDRRSFLRGGLSLIAAPAIVRVASLMPVRGLVIPATEFIRTAWGTTVETITIGDLVYMRPDGFVEKVANKVYHRDGVLGIWTGSNLLTQGHFQTVIET